MNRWDILLQSASEHVLRLASLVLARDNAHLAPRAFSPAAAARFKAGLRAIEAYLRRMILWLALQIEHDLPRENPEQAIYQRPARKRTNQNLSLKIFTAQHDFPDNFAEQYDPWVDRPQTLRPRAIPARPLLARLRALSDLAKAPEARARRLAWLLARKRPGPVMTPDLRRRYVPARYGTEVSAIYDSFIAGVSKASRARPPPLGPVRRPPPRIRTL
jgi:hypothetical protein